MAKKWLKIDPKNQTFRKKRCKIEHFSSNLALFPVFFWAISSEVLEKNNCFLFFYKFWRNSVGNFFFSIKKVNSGLFFRNFKDFCWVILCFFLKKKPWKFKYLLTFYNFSQKFQISQWDKPAEWPAEGGSAERDKPKGGVNEKPRFAVSFHGNLRKNL